MMRLILSIIGVVSFIICVMVGLRCVEDIRILRDWE